MQAFGFDYLIEPRPDILIGCNASRDYLYEENDGKLIIEETRNEQPEPHNNAVFHRPNTSSKAPSSTPIQLLDHTFLLNATLQHAAIRHISEPFRGKFRSHCAGLPAQNTRNKETKETALGVDYLKRGCNISPSSSVFLSS